MDAWVFQALLTFSPVNGVLPAIHQEALKRAQQAGDQSREDWLKSLDIMALEI